MRLEELNALDGESAARQFLRCCGSSRWARLMAAARPFASAEAMALVADAAWESPDLDVTAVIRPYREAASSRWTASQRRASA